jgi:hypothetical protein
MVPLLPFAVGLLAGVVGVKALKKAKTPEALGTLSQGARDGVERASSGLKDAAVSGLSALERSSASLRAKLENPSAQAEDGAPEGPEEPSEEDAIAEVEDGTAKPEQGPNPEPGPGTAS